jgi:hypothetical protein
VISWQRCIAEQGVTLPKDTPRQLRARLKGNIGVDDIAHDIFAKQQFNQTAVQSNSSSIKQQFNQTAVQSNSSSMACLAIARLPISASSP